MFKHDGLVFTPDSQNPWKVCNFPKKTLAKWGPLISDFLQREPQPHYHRLFLWIRCSGSHPSAEVIIPTPLLRFELQRIVHLISCSVIFSPFMSKILTKFMEKVTYRLQFTKSTRKTSVNSIDYSFTSHDVVSLILCALLGLWYLFKKVSTRSNITILVI